MFPDAESMLVAFLKTVVTVPVSTRVPQTRPASFVRVWRTGGAAVNRVLDRPTITVQAWADSSVDAAELARKCREALLSKSTTMPLVRGVEEQTGPYSDPDPETGIPRYSLTVRLSVRAQR